MRVRRSSKPRFRVLRLGSVSAIERGRVGSARDESSCIVAVAILLLLTEGCAFLVRHLGWGGSSR